MAISNSITITFGDKESDAAAADAHLSAEIDPRKTGLNAGVTNFKPGETAWMLIYMSANAGLDGDPIASAGTIGGGQKITGISKTQEVIFTNTDEASIQVPATSIVSTKWLGTSLGNLTLTGNNSKVKVGTKGVAVCKVTYLCDAIAHSLTSPVTLDGETSFSIAVLVQGKLLDNP